MHTMMTTQKELAEFLGVSPQMVSALKKGKRSLGKRFALRGECRTGIPAAKLMLTDGPDLIVLLQKAYRKKAKA